MLLLEGQALSEGNAQAIVSDGSSLYVVTGLLSPSVISRITIATFTRPISGPTQLQLAAGESHCFAVALNPDRTLLFTCSDGAPLTPTNCARVELAGFTRTGGVTLPRASTVRDALHDGTHLFLVSSTQPAVVSKIDTSGAMSVVTTAVMEAGANAARSITLLDNDTAHIYVFLGLSPMRAVKLTRRELFVAAVDGVAATGDNEAAPGGAFGEQRVRDFVHVAAAPRPVERARGVVRVPS